MTISFVFFHMAFYTDSNRYTFTPKILVKCF